MAFDKEAARRAARENAHRDRRLAALEQEAQQLRAHLAHRREALELLERETAARLEAIGRERVAFEAQSADTVSAGDVTTVVLDGVAASGEAGTVA